MKIDVHALAQKIRSGERRALAKAITLVEGTLLQQKQSAYELLKLLGTNYPNTIRIGVSGSPGVGKSTFLEAYGMHLIQQGHKVAVLAVDPSSPVSGGSILGDKTRMERLSAHADAFVRPSPSGTFSGGVARHTREAVFLCEAAGYDMILIETVGVGQSDIIVNSMVDVFMMLQLPNAGDELQGIKKGILEVADIVVITKADGEHIKAAKLAQLYHKNALHAFKSKDEWMTPVILSSSIENTGFMEIDAVLQKLLLQKKTDNSFEAKRRHQALEWLDQEIMAQLRDRIHADPRFDGIYNNYRQQVADLKIPSSRAAQGIIDELFDAEPTSPAKPVS